MALGCNKIAYAHHQDDFIETSLMNLMLEGHYDCFPPVTHLDRTNLQVLRPMLMIKERDVIGFARRENLPVVKNPCPADGHTRRQDVRTSSGAVATSFRRDANAYMRRCWTISTEM